jgi:hypothetical protein
LELSTPTEDPRLISIGPWGTQDELNYLSEIGTHTTHRNSDREELLRGYLKALKLRPRSERYLDIEVLRERAQRLLLTIE